MGKFEDLHIFVDVVNYGSIGQAAETHNIAKSAVSRRLKLLEQRYDVQLIDRRPGTWSVTEAGQDLYQRAVRVLTEAQELEADFSHARQSLAGPLSLSVPRDFGLAFLKPALLRFSKLYPEIQLKVDFDDRLVDLDNENYDLAVRISSATSENVISKTIGSTDHTMYASLDYMKDKGLPKSLSELVSHRLLNYGTERRAKWRFVKSPEKVAEKKVETVEFQPAINTNSGQFLVEATRDGLGIACLPDFLTHGAFARGELVRVLPEFELAKLSIDLTYSKNRLLNKRMRKFIEEVSSACNAIS